MKSGEPRSRRVVHKMMDPRKVHRAWPDAKCLARLGLWMDGQREEVPKMGAVDVTPLVIRPKGRSPAERTEKKRSGARIA